MNKKNKTKQRVYYSQAACCSDSHMMCDCTLMCREASLVVLWDLVYKNTLLLQQKHLWTRDCAKTTRSFL